jgi:FlaA1/EpsC-like NDP-sugar epimerase
MMKNIAIFGCGTAGKAAYLRLKSKCRVVAFLDNNKRKHGSRMFGLPVHNPESYDYSQIEHVFIASMYIDEILVQLLELHVPSSKIEYISDEVMMRSPSHHAGGMRRVSDFLNALRVLFYVPFRLLR